MLLVSTIVANHLRRAMNLGIGKASVDPVVGSMDAFEWAFLKWDGRTAGTRLVFKCSLWKMGPPVASTAVDCSLWLITPTYIGRNISLTNSFAFLGYCRVFLCSAPLRMQVHHAFVDEHAVPRYFWGWYTSPSTKYLWLQTTTESHQYTQIRRRLLIISVIAIWWIKACSTDEVVRSYNSSPGRW